MFVKDSDSVELQMICSRLLTLCIQLELEAIPTNYPCLTVFLMQENKFSVYWNNLPATSEHFSSFSSFKCFNNSVYLTSHVSLGYKYLVR